MPKYKIFLWLFCLLGLGASLQAQQSASFRLELRYDTVGLGEIFEVKYLIEGAEIKRFEPPHFDGFALVSGPMTSTNVSINNGQVKRSTSYSYRLQVIEGEGIYHLPRTWAETDQGALQSPERHIVVQLETPMQRQKQGDYLGANPFEGFGQDNFFQFQNPFGSGQDFFNLQFPSFQMPDFGQLERQMQQMFDQMLGQPLEEFFHGQPLQPQDSKKKKDEPKIYKL